MWATSSTTEARARTSPSSTRRAYSIPLQTTPILWWNRPSSPRTSWYLSTWPKSIKTRLTISLKLKMSMVEHTLHGRQEVALRNLLASSPEPIASRWPTTRPSPSPRLAWVAHPLTAASKCLKVLPSLRRPLDKPRQTVEQASVWKTRHKLRATPTPSQSCPRKARASEVTASLAIKLIRARIVPTRCPSGNHSTTPWSARAHQSKQPTILVKWRQLKALSWATATLLAAHWTKLQKSAKVTTFEHELFSAQHSDSCKTEVKWSAFIIDLYEIWASL